MTTWSLACLALALFRFSTKQAQTMLPQQYDGDNEKKTHTQTQIDSVTEIFVPYKPL